MTQGLKDQPNIIHAVSDTKHGNMGYMFGARAAVNENRDRFFTQHGTRKEDCVLLLVEHKERIEVVDDKHKRLEVSAEALITTTKGLTLLLLTGDCLPISFYEPKRRVIALAHLGWRSTDLRLVKKLVKRLTDEFHVDTKELLVDIGPGIHKESYVFDAESQKASLEWGQYVSPLPAGKIQVDLAGYNLSQLRSCGIPIENISISSIDTGSSKEYFSHYRSVRTKQTEGRFATILGMI